MSDESATSPQWFSTAYLPALALGISIQVILFILTVTMLDGGRTFAVFAPALFCQSLMTLLVVGRRPLAPTKSDLHFLRYGILALWFAVVVIAPLVSLMGGQPVIEPRHVLDFYLDQGLAVCLLGGVVTGVCVAVGQWLQVDGVK